MNANSTLRALLLARPTRRHVGLAALVVTTGAVLSAGWLGLEAQQRKWIFQATSTAAAPAALDSVAAAEDMQSVWIEHASASTGHAIRLHALWAANDDPNAPLLLFLHGARQHLGRSAYRVEQMRDLGFSVLAIDYRGFGASTAETPSEAGVVEDAAAAWRWLGAHHPGRARFVYGHSLGGAVAVQFAAQLASAGADDAPRGVIVEGTFTSIADMFGTFKWGWLPVSILITERFDSLAAVARIKAPLLVVHGSADALVPARFGRQLYERATAAKRFLLVEGGTHSSTSWRGAEQYRAALREFFGIGAAGAIR